MKRRGIIVGGITLARLRTGQATCRRGCLCPAYTTVPMPGGTKVVIRD